MGSQVIELQHSSTAGLPHTGLSVGTTLTIERLSKRYAEVEALAEVSLEIQGGEFFTLLGPSGCGKTTLLRCLAGFLRPDAGRILCDGKRLDALPAHKRDIGMVFQNYAIFPHLRLRKRGLRPPGPASPAR